MCDCLVAEKMFKHIFVVILGAFIFVKSSHGANILAVVPAPSYSHQIAFAHIWKELSLRGHSVTVLTTDPMKDPKLTNLTEIDLHSSYKFMKSVGATLQNKFNMWNMHGIIQKMSLQVADDQLSLPAVKELINSKKQFDVVLIEFVYPEYLAFAEIYNCPKIIIFPLEAISPFHNLMGNPTSPVLYPETVANFFVPLSFKERVISTLFTWYLSYFYPYKVFFERDELVKKHFKTNKTIYEMMSEVDLMFLNVNPILQPIRPLGPSTITIGGNREVVTSTTLPEDIVDFLNDAEEGFIYFSLGSNVKSKDLSIESKNSITDAFRDLPYKVLWKFEADDLPNKPENVKLIKWAPQQNILAHPNIKLFITQGGLQSMEEAFYREVPSVVIPFFGDQIYNAQIMESKGFAVKVNKNPSINKHELKSAILEVINNPKYKNNVRRLKHLALDFPMSGPEKAIWWTEYVIRNKGAKHLRNPAADVPYYQYYLLDVIAFLLVTLISVLILFYLLLRTIYRRVIVNKVLEKRKQQ